MKLLAPALRPADARPEPRAATGARQVEAQRTPVTRADLRGAIGRAYEKVTGRPASGTLLDTLTAQASLETASGAQMYNYNFGGIKGASPSGETAVCRTKEVYGGREMEVRDGFRAYRSLDEGALDYVRLMRGRFGAAVARAEAGDLDGFAYALKQASYYTADEAKYASALRALSGAAASEGPRAAPRTLPSRFEPTYGALAEGGESPRYVDTVELGRVLDAIGRVRPAERASDDEDE